MLGGMSRSSLRFSATMEIVEERCIQVVAEEEQQFLSRQQQFLSQGLPPQQSGAMPTGDQLEADVQIYH